ncbi:Nucleotide-binding universal stress protein, UspA family [Rathayibacter oskolensis]|uniref:Nucleotide-binding universal stress protein, UspA family n=1 Tax=Rathayibacter oskolensis TaxID=1891671 RepID=A0A1X7PB24_9MICO|nr:universal stress protein [Rathayibacter oskolensis]SMH48336.1 Nucleotide-binding universal stress protein, UspA family [Rathayibacter oskolensis]
MNAQLVVGWDGSATARRALAWALTQTTEPLLLVQVVDGLDRFSGVDQSADPRAAEAVSLETAAADAERAHPGSRISTRMLVGDPVVQLAAMAGPDTLLVVGDRRRELLPMRGGWSKGARLAARAAGPVAIITHDSPTDGTGVLVGIDDSDDARAALAFAATWAAATQQTLHVLHAWRTPFLWNDRVPPGILFEEIAAQHAELLADAVTEAARLHPGLVVEGHEVDGVAARSLLEAAPGRALLVVGDGGVSFFERMLIGSVGHDVLVNLAIPTVIVGRHSRAPQPDPVATAPAPLQQPPARTLVAWGGDLPSRSAVEWALARETSGSLEVVMIADEAAVVPDSEAAAEAVAVDERSLAVMIEQVRPLAPDVSLHGRVVRGFVLHTLAGLTDPDTLLVVGTEDREGPRLRFGFSVGAHLPALARGPIAIVPRTVDTTLTGVAVGVNGSVSSNAAIVVAAAEATRRGETLHLVHAWTEPALYDGMILLDGEFLRSLETEHRTILDAAEQVALTGGFSGTITTHLVRGDPAHALARLSPKAATIVIGTRGLSGWRRLVLGSVSRDLILNLDTPLIVVGRPDALPVDDASLDQHEAVSA